MMQTHIYENGVRTMAEKEGVLRMQPSGRHRMSTGNWERRTLSRMTTRWSTNNCSATSSSRRRARTLLVLRSACSSWEICTFRIAMRCRASAISRLVLARLLYQVLCSIAEFRFPHAALRLGCSAVVEFLTATSPIIRDYSQLTTCMVIVPIGNVASLGCSRM